MLVVLILSKNNFIIVPFLTLWFFKVLQNSKKLKVEMIHCEMLEFCLQANHSLGNNA